jgi:2'-5' RNA ligase
VRLFVALEIPAAVRENFAKFLQQLREVDAKPRWIRPENLHITLRFIGEVESGQVERIRGELAKVRSTGLVRLEFHGLGFFPHEKKPRVFWAAMAASANLAQLAADVDAAVEKAGVSGEQRPFSPHLTLARFSEPRLSSDLSTAVESKAGLEFGALETSEFHLYESKLTPKGSEYSKLATFRFHEGE